MKRLLLLLTLGLSALSAAAQSRPTVSILGDSYSTFEGWMTPDTMKSWYYAADAPGPRTDVVRVSQTWWWQLIERMGWKLGVNNSYSGTTVCQTGYNGEDYSGRSFIARLADLGSPDIVLIFGATNDDWAGVPMGRFQYDRFTPADLYAFRPGLAYLLQKTRERYPTAELYFIGNSDLRDDTTESIRTICDHYGVPLIQLNGIDKLTGHPSARGMSQIADQVAAAIQNGSR